VPGRAGKHATQLSFGVSLTKRNIMLSSICGLIALVLLTIVHVRHIKMHKTPLWMRFVGKKKSTELDLLGKKLTAAAAILFAISVMLIVLDIG
jgi:hypothetical protein